MTSGDIADLTDEERLLLVLCVRQRKPKTGTVRATSEQLQQRLGWTHGDLRQRLGMLVDVEAIVLGDNGRITVPETTATLVDAVPALREVSSRLARSGAGAHASLEARDFGDSGSTPLLPPTGGGEYIPPPLVSPPTGKSTRRRGEKNWTPYDLANHFATRVTQFAMHSQVPPGVSNKKALAAQFRAWQSEGFDAADIRSLVDYFAANLGRYVNSEVPVWKSFLARRADIWADFRDDQPEVYDEPVETASEWSLDSA